MKQAFRNLVYSRAYEKVISLGGFKFFKRVNKLDSEHHFKEFEKSFNSDGEACEFIQDIILKDLDMRHPLWQCYISQIANNHGYAILVYHNSMADMVSILINLLRSFDNYHGVLQKMLSLPILNRIGIYLTFPIQIIIISIKLMLLKRNKIDRTTCHTMAISDDIDLEKIKKVAIDNNCSINDVIMNIIFQNINLDSVLVSTLYTVRVESAKYFPMPLDSRLSGASNIFPTKGPDALKEISTINKNLALTMPFIYSYMVYFIIRWIMPSKLYTLVMNHINSKHPLVFCSIAGPNYQINHEQTKLSSIFYFANNIFNNSCNVIATTYNGKLKITCNSCTSNIPPKPLIEQIHRTLSKY
jgi:hypothetical protein